MDDTTKKIISDMLNDPTAEVEMFAGMKETTKPGATDASYEPDGSKTVVVKIKGGANNVRVERIKIEGDDEDDD